MTDVFWDLKGSGTNFILALIYHTWFNSYWYVNIILHVICVCVPVCVCTQSLSCVWLVAILWTVIHQASLSMGFSKQEQWSGLPFPPPGGLPSLWLLHLLHCRQIIHHWGTWEALVCDNVCDFSGANWKIFVSLVFVYFCLSLSLSIMCYKNPKLILIFEFTFRIDYVEIWYIT